MVQTPDRVRNRTDRQLSWAFRIIVTVAYTTLHNTIYVHVLMREREGKKKEERKKQARSNKQHGKETQHTQHVHIVANVCT